MDGGCFQNACVSLTLPHPRLLILGLPPLCHFTPSLKCLISQKCAKLGLCLMLLHVLKVPHRFCKGSFLFEEPNIGIFFWDISTELGCHSKCHTWMHAYRAWMLCQKSYFGNETPNPAGLSDPAPTSELSKKILFLETASTLHGDDKLCLLSSFILFLAPFERGWVFFFPLLPPHCIETTSKVWSFSHAASTLHIDMSKTHCFFFLLPPHYRELVVSFLSCDLHIAWRWQAKLVVFFLVAYTLHGAVISFFLFLALLERQWTCMELIISLFFGYWLPPHYTKMMKFVPCFLFFCLWGLLKDLLVVFAVFCSWHLPRDNELCLLPFLFSAWHLLKNDEQHLFLFLFMAPLERQRTKFIIFFFF
jgi:hypothetical protein